MTSHDHDEELDVEEVSVNGLGGTSFVPFDDERDTTPGEAALEDDSVHDAAEDDDELLSGHSPEFERLTKPVHPSES